MIIGRSSWYVGKSLASSGYCVRRKEVIWLIGVAIGLMVIGLVAGISWLGRIGAIVALLLSLWVIGTSVFSRIIWRRFFQQQWRFRLALLAAILAAIGLTQVDPLNRWIRDWWQQINWDGFGTLIGLLSAVGQILIAVLALYVTWEQFVTTKRLTTQQNTVTQQQTIDAYFQGIAELTLDDDGLLEDFPLERAIAEGRTAAILGSVDAAGKAKVLRFLSSAGLLTPLLRDQRLGRAILDGVGGYAEDRVNGVRVIDLGVMLAGANLEGADLRWTDLSDINMIRANLHRCDLVRTNLARTILSEADFSNSDLFEARLFYGSTKTATPRTRAEFPNYKSGAYTGAVIEDADFTKVQRLSESQRYYCCAWGGSKTRKTIPGGCEGIPNLLGR
jgi:uncharacterized protein YjbI with pentapeptide repeats